MVFPLHRTPHLSNRIEASFLLHVRTYDAIRAEVAHWVEDIIHIRTYHSLIHEVPKETACTTRIGHHQLPIVFQTGTVSTVVQSVQELGGHENFLLTHILRRFAPRTIVLGLKAVAVGPRVEHHALLRV